MNTPKIFNKITAPAHNFLYQESFNLP